MTLVVGFDIATIRTDGGTHGRAQLDEPTVQAYLADILSGARFPPIILFYDGEVYWLSDGFHRLEVARRAGFQRIDAEVRRGTRRDAILHGIAANGRQGFPRTRKDKRHAVETLLRDPEWSRWSNREIARRCLVHNTTVDEVRQRLSRSHARRKEAGKRQVPVTGSDPAPAENGSRTVPVTGNPPKPPEEESMSGPLPVTGTEAGGLLGEPPESRSSPLPAKGTESWAPPIHGRGATAIARAHLHKVLGLIGTGAGAATSLPVADLRALVKAAVGELDELERGAAEAVVEKAAPPAATASKRRKAMAPTGKLSVQSALVSQLVAKGARSVVERLLEATERPGSHWPYLEIRALVEFVHKEASECTD